jgi:hypothetical protein
MRGSKPVCVKAVRTPVGSIPMMNTKPLVAQPVVTPRRALLMSVDWLAPVSSYTAARTRYDLKLWIGHLLGGAAYLPR